MQIQVEIGFDQLLKLVRALPASKLKRLQKEIEKDVKQAKFAEMSLEQLILNGPTATSEDLRNIEQNRNSINAWRKL
jgi:hypothetical protein